GTTDLTEAGCPIVGGPQLPRPSLVSKPSTATLTPSVLCLPARSSPPTPLPYTTLVRSSDTFTVQFNTGAATTWLGDISFNTNDSDENPSNVRLTGTLLTAPEIPVSGNGIDIADGDTTLSPAGLSDFGSAIVGGAAAQRT